MKFLGQGDCSALFMLSSIPFPGSSSGRESTFLFSLQDLGFVLVSGDHHEEGEVSDPGAGNCWAVSYDWN